MIKNILFSVDFSTSSVEMAPYVQRAAEIFRWWLVDLLIPACSAA